MNKHKIVKVLLTLIILFLVIWAAQSAIRDVEFTRGRNLPMQVRLMDAIVDTGGAIVEVDQSTGTILRCTTNLETMLGYSSESLKGKSLDVLIPQWFHAPHRKLMSDYRPVDGGGTIILKCFIPRNDGSLAEMVVSVFLVPSGNLIALIRPSERVRFKDVLSPPSASFPKTVHN